MYQGCITGLKSSFVLFIMIYDLCLKLFSFFKVVSNVEIDDDVAKLTHPAKNIFVFKRRTSGEVVTRYFTDGCYHFSENLRLRGAMFNHHMPWSYNGLFQGYGLDQPNVTKELVTSVLKY